MRALRRNRDRSTRDQAWAAWRKDRAAGEGPEGGPGSFDDLDDLADLAAVPRCEVTLLETDRGLTLRVRGSLDAQAMPALTAQFDQLQCTACDQAVLDLNDVLVVDCVGLNAVAGLCHYVSGRGGTLLIRCRPGAIRGLLVSIGLGSRLEELEGGAFTAAALAQPA